jgi:hypothetical protein
VDEMSEGKTFKVVGNDVSDGYHTFDELYDHRITLFIALCRKVHQEQEAQTRATGWHQRRRVWRAKKHADGSMFDGWFVLGIDHHHGEQITYHLPLSRWEETDFAVELTCAPKFDGHTPADVLERLKRL